MKTRLQFLHKPVHHITLSIRTKSVSGTVYSLNILPLLNDKPSQNDGIDENEYSKVLRSFLQQLQLSAIALIELQLERFLNALQRFLQRDSR